MACLLVINICQSMYVDVLIKVNNNATDSSKKIKGISSEEPCIEDCGIVISDLVTRYMEYIEQQDSEKAKSFESSILLLSKYNQIKQDNGDYPYDTKYYSSVRTKVDYFLKELCATFKDGCWPQDSLTFTMLWNVYKRDCAEQELAQQNNMIKGATVVLGSLDTNEQLLNIRNEENKKLISVNTFLRNQLTATKLEEENTKKLLSNLVSVIQKFAKNFLSLEIGGNEKNKIISQFHYTDISLMSDVESYFKNLKIYIFLLETENKKLTEEVSKLECDLKKQKNPTSSIETEKGSPFFYKFTTFAFFCTTLYLAYINYYRN